MQRLLFVAALIAGAQSTSAAQTLKKCDDPKVPIGVLPRGSASIWYRLAKNGKPDTVGMGVVEVQGISVVGVRSVAAPLLSGCRFDVPMGEPSSCWLLTKLTFESDVPTEATLAAAAFPP